ncbi:hypothetical protein ZWY2020_040493 [Hordeum vulgare]|nr:hypothetical protein ZWY2020_040493 [Hordeum vulgare]
MAPRTSPAPQTASSPYASDPAGTMGARMTCSPGCTSSCVDLVTPWPCRPRHPPPGTIPNQIQHAAEFRKPVRV